MINTSAARQHAGASASEAYDGSVPGGYSLRKSVAVVTGGGGLIGVSIASLLATIGAHIVVVDTDEGRGQTAVARILADGGAATALTADVGDELAVNNLFAAIDRLGYPLRVLVNCAAPVALALQEQPAADIVVSTWDEMLRISLRGTMLCCRAALRRMVAYRAGSIVNISSVHAHGGDLTMVAYPVAKAGIIALTRSIATQYGRASIRCNVVSPGTIPPDQIAQVDIERRLQHQAIERAGQPRDIAAAVAYLATDASSFVTGQELIVDGGLLCHLPSFATGGHVQKSR